MGAYSVTIDPRGSYLHCVVRGDNDRDTVLAYFHDIREACRTRDCYRILIEERLDGPRFPPEVLLPLMGEVVAWAGASFEALAYVDVNASSDTIARFAGQVVQPGAAVGVFATVADAERWMRAKEGVRAPEPPTIL